MSAPDSEEVNDRKRKLSPPPPDAAVDETDVSQGKKRKGRKTKASSGPVTCDVCGITVNSEIILQTHILGKPHQRKLRLRLNNAEAESVVAPNGPNFRDSEVATTTSTTFTVTEQKVPSASTNPGNDASIGLLKCELCNVTCIGRSMFETHLTGQKHSKKLKRKQEIEESGLDKVINSEFYCKLCDVELTSKEQMILHVAGKKHKQKAADSGEKTDDVSLEDQISNASIDWEKYKIPDDKKTSSEASFTYCCSLCKKLMNGKLQLIMHIRSKKHQNKLSGGQITTRGRGRERGFVRPRSGHVGFINPSYYPGMNPVYASTYAATHCSNLPAANIKKYKTPLCSGPQDSLQAAPNNHGGESFSINIAAVGNRKQEHFSYERTSQPVREGKSLGDTENALRYNTHYSQFDPFPPMSVTSSYYPNLPSSNFEDNRLTHHSDSMYSTYNANMPYYPPAMNYGNYPKADFPVQRSSMY